MNPNPPASGNASSSPLVVFLPGEDGGVTVKSRHDLYLVIDDFLDAGALSIGIKVRRV